MREIHLHGISHYEFHVSISACILWLITDNSKNLIFVTWSKECIFIHGSIEVEQIVIDSSFNERPVTTLLEGYRILWVNVESYLLAVEDNWRRDIIQKRGIVYGVLKMALTRIYLF